jgi:release factor glutamine methyltransferase
VLIKTALTHGRGQLDPTDARLLLQHLLGVSYAYLLAHDDESLTANQAETYLAWVARAGQGEPIPYILGTAPFYGREFVVSPAVLIPRPETEQVVRLGVAWLQAKQGWRMVDVGTGSGCIPLSVALALPGAGVVTAVDISAPALHIAQQNGQKHEAVVHYWQGDLLTAVAGSFDLITANLPYITDAEWTSLADGVKSYEPTLALRGGADGLRLVEPLLRQALTRLASPGLMLLEIGWQQGEVTVALAEQIFPHATVTLYHDEAGHGRVVAIQQVS